ncbi:DUF402 domain-containing protein [Bacillus sp. NTK074B]|uniref:DUF402 domain-containing protein n=1 Tax=Bacillus sp. NTK074B TaxID=2802174 RepID=UPI001A8C6122|nr:DUF402 domain-containing protein [Bacillus sp. NTK074B]
MIVYGDGRGGFGQVGDRIIERKFGYDGSVVDHSCRVLKMGVEEAVLFHKIEDDFTMSINESSLTVQKGSYTIAHYWENRAYNLYIWRDYSGEYVGSYFNIVKNTNMNNEVVSFEDLIIDLLVFKDGKAFVLDEDELLVSIEEFENGLVLKELNELVDELDRLLPKLISDSRVYFPHDVFLGWLRDPES